jgi:hypothetical protein
MTGHPLAAEAQQEDSDLEKVEKRFVELKTALVEKCQSSKM